MSHYTIISDAAKHGYNVKIGNFCEIRDNCEIGDNTSFGSRCTLSAGTKVGKNCIIKYGFVATDIPNLNRPSQKRTAIIGDYVLIGANVVLMPGVKVGNNAKIDVGLVIFKDVKDGEILRNIGRT